MGQREGPSGSQRHLKTFDCVKHKQSEFPIEDIVLQYGIKTNFRSESVGAVVLLEGEPVGGETVVIEVGEIMAGATVVVDHHAARNQLFDLFLI